MIQLCRHIFAGGKLCEQAAVRGSMFCRHHGTVKMALAREKAAPDPAIWHTPIAFVYPEDRAAVQLNLFMVLQALNSKRIDLRTANAMGRLLRSCEANLRKGELAEQDRDKVVKRVVKLLNGDEVGLPHHELEEGDDPEKIHPSDCHCEECCKRFTKVSAPRHREGCRCAACVPAAPPVSETTTAKPAEDASQPVSEPAEDAEEDAKTDAPKDEIAPLPPVPARTAREQRERDEAAMDALAAEYELRIDGEVKWKKGMKEALLEDFKQSMADGKPYQPRELAASGA